MADHLSGNAQDIGRGSVVVHHGDTIGCGVLAFLPTRKALEEKFEAAEGGATEAIDGLIVVANNDDVARFRAQEMQQFELRDIGVLKFIDQDVRVSILKLAAALGVLFKKGDGFGDQAVQGNGALFFQDFLAGTIGAGNFLLEGHLLGAFLQRVIVERVFLGLQLPQRVDRRRIDTLRWRRVRPGNAKKK